MKPTPEPILRRTPASCRRFHRWQRPNLYVLAELVLGLAIYLAVFLGVVWWVG